jgi:hypothetical protein
LKKGARKNPDEKEEEDKNPNIDRISFEKT